MRGFLRLYHTVLIKTVKPPRYQTAPLSNRPAIKPPRYQTAPLSNRPAIKPPSSFVIVIFSTETSGTYRAL